MSERPEKIKKPLWKPEPGSSVIAQLPQEMIQAQVIRYINNDTMEAKLCLRPPLSKSHNYRFNQMVTLHRRKAQPLGEKWVTEDSEAA